MRTGNQERREKRCRVRAESRTLHFEWENDDAIGIFVHDADTALEASVVEDSPPPSGSKTVQVSKPGEYTLHVVCDGSWRVTVS